MIRAEDIPEITKNWSPEAKMRLLQALESAESGDLRAWYCTRGRSCDGKPHEQYDYPHARGDQWPPAGQDWFIWGLMGGRGSGKTRTGAEYIRRLSEKVGRIALIAPTAPDARDTMVEGESGLVSVFANVGQEIKYEPSKRRITFPSGSRATLFSGEEPDRLRGPQHGAAWIDEPAHIPLIQDVWDMLLFGLRLGERPHVILTTTPKPTKWVKEIIKDPGMRLVRASTYANIDNLAPSFRQRVLSRFEGTRLGKQELYGEILEDVEGALWNGEMLLYDSLTGDGDLQRIVVSIDPAGSQGKKSDETGIVAVGKMGEQGLVLADRTDRYSPQEWAREAMRLYERLQADAIVVERNYGGDMVRANLKQNGFNGRIIENAASRGKELRAEPIVSLYEQGRIFHRKDAGLQKLEEEMLSWVPGEGKSPNRVDALVWGLTELFKPGGRAQLARPTSRTTAQQSARRPGRRLIRPGLRGVA